jgi:biotin carboxylase
MSGKRDEAVWIFAGGPMQEPAARKVKERGFRLIISDRDSGCVCARYADELVERDTFDIPGNMDASRWLARRYEIRAVLPPAADCHETVAHVARSLGLPAVSPKLARTCRQKHLTREALTAAGIPQPGFRLVHSANEARAFIRELGGEGVIKATDNSGSRGFASIGHPDEVTEEVYAHAVAEGTTGAALVEERLRPLQNEIAEQSVETLWYNGRMYWLNWVDRLFRQDFLRFPSISTGVYADVGWGVELGHINPAVHDFTVKQSVQDLMLRAGRAIGMHRERGGHILKGDIMLTQRGPVLIELTPRLSGGWDSSGSTPARGADFVGGVISMALGERLTLDLWDRYFEYKNQNLYASVLAQVSAGARDCIGRRFAIGADFERERAVECALRNLREGRHVIPVEQ